MVANSQLDRVALSILAFPPVLVYPESLFVQIYHQYHQFPKKPLIIVNIQWENC